MSGSLRVLHVLNGLNPLLGGPPVAVRNIVVAAARQGLDVQLAACDVGGAHVDEMARDLESEGVALRAFEIGVPGEPAARWGVSAPMLRYLWAEIPSFDIVHVHGAWSMTSLTGSLRGRLTKTPVVMTPHESLTRFDIDQSRSRWRRRQKEIVGRALLQAVDLVVFSSEIERRDSEIVRRPLDRVIAHPVVDERLGVPLARSAPRRPLRVGFLGRLHPKKNLPLLLDAIALSPGAELLIAGAGAAAEEGAYRNRAKQLGLGQRVTWLGFVGGDARREFLHDIDVLAMPSRYECFGVAAAEAMWAGVPVIAPPQVGVATAIQKYRAGIVAPPDPRSIAAAIIRFRDDAELVGGCSEGALRAALEEFSFERFGSEIARIYWELAPQPRARLRLRHDVRADR